MLSLHYPDTSLLPDNSVLPYLCPPANFELRRAPDRAGCHADTVGTRFFARLPLLPCSDFPLSAHDILGAVENLRTITGNSTLHMISYAREDYEGSVIYHRICLRTKDYVLEAKEFELTDSEYQRMVIRSNGKEWVHLLDNLVTRASDRAFFEVYNRLATKHGFNIADKVACWDGLWGSCQPPDTNELFEARLMALTEADAERLKGLQDGIIKIMLPCCHTIEIRRVQLASLTEEAMWKQTCPECGCRILQPEDIVDIDITRTNQESEDYKEQNLSWSKLDTEWADGTTVMSFNPAELRDALDKARWSFDAPASITPASLNPAYYSETMALAIHFCTELGPLSVRIETTPFNLMYRLREVASGARRVGMDEGGLLVAKTLVPEEWKQFQEVWLLRAVRYLVDLLSLDATADDDDSEEEVAHKDRGGGEGPNNSGFDFEDTLMHVEEEMRKVEIEKKQRGTDEFDLEL